MRYMYGVYMQNEYLTHFFFFNQFKLDESEEYKCIVNDDENYGTKNDF